MALPTQQIFAQPSVGAQLAVLNLNVTPRVLQSGDIVAVDARVANRGDVPVYGLQLSLAIAETGVPLRRWVPLEQNPPGPIEELGPGEEVSFSGKLRVEGNGWYRVGMVASAANLQLAPQGQRVRVIEPSSALIQALGVLLVYLLILGAAAGSARVLLRSKGDAAARFRPSWLVIIAGLVLMVVVPIVLGLYWSSAAREYGFAFMPGWVYPLPFGGLASFLVGWLVSWSGLRPQASALRGALLGAILYFGLGLMWVIAFNVILSGSVLGSLHLVTLFLATMWPLQVAQVLGLFGLSMG